MNLPISLPRAVRCILFQLLLLVSLAASVRAQNIISNGAQTQGSISSGTQEDTWLFTGKAGDTVVGRVGTVGFTPRLRLFAPDNSLLMEAAPTSSLVRDAFVTNTLPADGTYRFTVSTVFPNQKGDYTLNLALGPGAFAPSPGDESGPIGNGETKSGTLTIGDLDLWSFNANAGDSIVVRAGSTNFTPWILVIAPTGDIAAEVRPTSTLVRDSFVAFSATNSGVYTIVVSATFANTSGGYGISLAQAPTNFTVNPGDEGGVLTNGIANSGVISLGDLDLWSFNANVGDSLVIRAGTTNFTPWLRIYGPTGALVEEDSPTSTLVRDGVIVFQAPATGNYLVVLTAKFANTSGTYGLHLADIPQQYFVSSGDEGGTLTNGFTATGSMPFGDLDIWSFDAQAGNSIFLRMGSTNFTPWLRLYDPSGALVEEAKPTSTLVADAFIAATATNSGQYFLVASADFLNTAGTYGLTLVLTPAPVVIAPGDEGGNLINGRTNYSTLERGDVDVWTFEGTYGDTNRLQVIATNFTPWVRLYGPDGKLVDEVKPGSTLVRTALLGENITNNGTYTIIVSAVFANQSGTYSFRESRVPPDLNVPADQAIDEQTTFTGVIWAQDPDDPSKLLNFALRSGPPGMTLTANSVTNATLSWTPSEADGPSTNEVVVTVDDLLNAKVFTRTNRFTLVVREINTPPQVQTINDVTMDELTPLNVQVQASDADIPENVLTYSLITPPNGMTINPATGQITWTPNEGQGPGDYTINVVVTDTNPLASNAIQLSTTNAFHVQVHEVNSAPRLNLPEKQTMLEKTLLSVNVTAGDSDIPANNLVFSIVSGPAGATINPSTGLLTWTPSEADGPSTNIIKIQVLDNGVPSLATQDSMEVIVQEVNSAPSLTLPSTQSIAEKSTLNVTAVGSDPDIPANPLTYKLNSSPPGMSINAQTGQITWTPTEDQGPGTYTVVVEVSDNQTPALTKVESFTVNVTEVNSAPTFTVPDTQTINELSPFSITLSATDDDVPANIIAWSVIAPPTGLTINPATGAIAWTPTEAQGPSTNTIQVVATDNGSPAMSTTNSFQLIVKEVNTAPQLLTITNQTLHFEQRLLVQAVATDADLPANKLTYSIDQGPQGLEINSTNGTITWLPAQADLGTHSVTVRVTDDANPSASATTSFQVTVTGEGSDLAISRVGGLVQLSITGDINQRYEIQKSSDLKEWASLLQFQLNQSPYLYIDAEPATNRTRFYRLKFLE